MLGRRAAVQGPPGRGSFEGCLGLGLGQEQAVFVLGGGVGLFGQGQVRSDGRA